MMSRSVIPIALLCCSATGFVPLASRVDRSSALHVTANPTFVANRFYQLEELEDKDDCSTEVYLKDDGRVLLTGKTDGPPPIEATGSWEMAGHDFTMTLTRTYDGGQQPSRSTDVGEFKYAVTRRYDGALSHVGEEVAVTGGKIHSLHEQLGDEEVGFWNLICTEQQDLKKAAP